MRRIALLGAILWGAAAMTGCGSSETPPPEAQAQAEPKAPPVPPEVITREWLEAVRTGDDLKAETFLTDLAREKMKEHDLQVSPPASQTAKYEIGEVEMVEGKLAYVESYWTDIGDNGKPKTTPYIWALRMDSNGWRIGGVILKEYDDVSPLMADFENPEEMLKKLEELDQQLKQRMNAPQGGNVAASANGTPGNPASAGGQPGAAVPPTGVHSNGAQTMATTPGALPPGAFPGASSPTNPAVTGATLPAAIGGAGNTTATSTTPPGAIVPAGGFQTPAATGSVQPTGAQAAPAPGFLPPGAQAQQSLPPGTLPR